MLKRVFLGNSHIDLKRKHFCAFFIPWNTLLQFQLANWLSTGRGHLSICTWVWTMLRICGGRSSPAVKSMLGLGQLLHTQAIIPGEGREVLRYTASRSKDEASRNLRHATNSNDTILSNIFHLILVVFSCL